MRKRKLVKSLGATLLFIFLFVTLLSSITLADTNPRWDRSKPNPDPQYYELNEQAAKAEENFMPKLSVVLSVMWGILIFVFAFGMVKNGITLLTATNPNNAEEGKEGVKKCLLGFAVVILAGLIASIIVGAILGPEKVPIWGWIT
jgi:ABC-type phosphate transport system permease subunit